MNGRGFYWPWPLSAVEGPIAFLAVLTFLACVLLVAVIFIASFVLPAAAVGGIVWLVVWYLRRPKKTVEIYQTVDTTRAAAQFPDAHAFFEAYSNRYDTDCIKSNVTPAGYNVQRAMLALAVQLYDAEGFTETKTPLLKVVEGSVQMGEYRDQLLDQAKKVENPIKTVDIFTRTLSQAFVGFTTCLPEVATEKVDREAAEKSSGITISLKDALGENGKQAITYLISPFFQEDVRDLHLFSGLFAQLDKNFDEVDDDEVVRPHEYKGDLDETIDQYLKFTPLKDLLSIQIPWRLPKETRFEHQWIVAPQGAGKTQLIQYQLSRDIEDVRDGEASVVVMDSQGDLINLVSHLARIPQDKLVIIEPDPLFPLALNPFDVGKSRLATYDARTREMLDNSAIELLSYVFDNLLGTATTQKQTALFQNVIRLCRVIPDANIKTLAEILGTAGIPYPEYIGQLPEVSQEFFQHQFADPKQFKETKTELAWRLSLLRGNTTFERMFGQKHSKLDLFEELNSSKVILINTDKALLKEKGTELFGRFFIALLLQAAQERAALERSKRLPTWVYIDECQDYIANDSNVTTILDQARKMNIGVVLAHQRTGQVDKTVLDALTNVSIKCARAVNDSGAHVLARNMSTTPEFISKQPVGHFAIAIQNNPALSIRIPPFVMEKMQKIGPGDMKVLKHRMQQKYSVPYIPPEIPEPPMPKPRARVKDGRLVPADPPSGNPQPETQRPTNWPMA